MLNMALRIESKICRKMLNFPPPVVWICAKVKRPAAWTRRKTRVINADVDWRQTGGSLLRSHRRERERERELLLKRETEHLWLRQLMHGIGGGPR